MTNKRKIRRAKNLDGKRKRLMKKSGLMCRPYLAVPNSMIFYEPCTCLFFKSTKRRIGAMCELFDTLINYYKQE